MMRGKSSNSKGKKRLGNRRRTVLNFSQEKNSYCFFIGLLIIAIFACVASGAPRQGFYGILFISIGTLIALFPPAFIVSKWLYIGLGIFFISMASSLLPRDFAKSQSWRINLETLGLETGNLISPHPAVTIEFLIIAGSIIILILSAFGHRVNRDSFLKIAGFFVIAIASYTGVAMIFFENEWQWAWDNSKEFGFFPNRNHMATLMVMGSLVGVGCLFLNIKTHNWLTSLTMLLGLGIICWGILGYSMSRAGLVLLFFLKLHGLLLS